MQSRKEARISREESMVDLFGVWVLWDQGLI